MRCRESRNCLLLFDLVELKGSRYYQKGEGASVVPKILRKANLQQRGKMSRAFGECDVPINCFPRVITIGTDSSVSLPESTVG